MMPLSTSEIGLSFVKQEQCLVTHHQSTRSDTSENEYTLAIRNPLIDSILTSISKLNINFSEFQGNYVLDGESMTLTIKSGDSSASFSWMGELPQAWQSLADIVDMIEQVITTNHR